MKIAFFGSQPYDRRFFDEALPSQPDASSIELVYHDALLGADTAILARGAGAVCVFVNDVLDAAVLEALHGYGVRAILLRCAGYNNLDLPTARRLGFFVARVPAYSPEAVAEHTLAMVQTLNRHTHRAYARVREGNFSLDGLLGFNLHGRRSASSAPARSAWPRPASSGDSAARCWATIPILRLILTRWAPWWACHSCWPKRTSSRCIAR